MRGVPFANKLFVVDVVDELKLTCFLVSKFYVCTTGALVRLVCSLENM